MPNLMLLSTAWGPKHGGINAFNMDFAAGLVQYLNSTGEVFCAVLQASSDDYADTKNHGVKLISIDKSPHSSSYDDFWAYAIWEQFREKYPDCQIDWWIGHDVVSGAAAIKGPDAAKSGHSAVIMHMNYIDYAGFKRSSSVYAIEKEKQQREIFEKANKHFAVGPLLRNAMHDMVKRDVTMLVPGFPNIQAKPSTDSLILITFGRMDRESDRIKQGTLAVAGLASTCRKADEVSWAPASLKGNPQMRVIGIAQDTNEEDELHKLAEAKAGRHINILAQPFTEDRKALFDQLGQANLALMLSWHEGFGLTDWEAIAAQVPLIVSSPFKVRPT